MPSSNPILLTPLTASHIALGIVLSVASLALGFRLGSRHPHLDRINPRTPPKQEPSSQNQGTKSEEDEEESILDGDLAAVQAGFMEQCKLVLVVRTDLKMTPGKIAAQCGHATLACYKVLLAKNPKLIQHWERTGQAKVALKIASEEELLELEAIAKSLNLCARSIEDAGRTQVAEGSRTVLGIGPAPIALINQVTGKLRLL